MFSFQIKSFNTLISTYTWDDGVPGFESITNNTTDGLVVSGYAPYVSVEFEAAGVRHLPSGLVGPSFETYIDWDFGDFYNHTENKETILREANETVRHTYSMPGTYTVSFIARELYRVYTDKVYDPLQDVCRAGDALWGWKDTTFGKKNQQTWNAQITSRKPWVEPEACLDKFCIPWTWSSLATSIRWSETFDTSNNYPKMWTKQGFSEPTPCQMSTFKYYLSTDYTYVTNNTCKITVVEKPPVANLYSTNQSNTTSSPASAFLCADGCISGSFPIQRIVWDFNDGTDLLEIDRFNIDAIVSVSVFYNNSFPNDINDPRNYSVVHEYNSTEKVTFYPSISVYSCNTSTSDRCSTTFRLPVKETLDISIVNSRCINDNLFLASTYLDTLCLHKIDMNNVTSISSADTLDVSAPPNTIRNYPGKLTNSQGNDGTGFAELLKNQIQRYEYL